MGRKKEKGQKKTNSKPIGILNEKNESASISCDQSLSKLSLQEMTQQQRRIYENIQEMKDFLPDSLKPHLDAIENAQWSTFNQSNQNEYKSRISTPVRPFISKECLEDCFHNYGKSCPNYDDIDRNQWEVNKKQLKKCYGVCGKSSLNYNCRLYGVFELSKIQTKQKYLNSQKQKDEYTKKGAYNNTNNFVHANMENIMTYINHHLNYIYIKCVEYKLFNMQEIREFLMDQQKWVHNKELPNIQIKSYSSKVENVESLIAYISDLLKDLHDKMSDQNTTDQKNLIGFFQTFIAGDAIVREIMEIYSKVGYPQISQYKQLENGYEDFIKNDFSSWLEYMYSREVFDVKYRKDPNDKCTIVSQFTIYDFHCRSLSYSLMKLHEQTKSKSEPQNFSESIDFSDSEIKEEIIKNQMQKSHQQSVPANSIFAYSTTGTQSKESKSSECRMEGSQFCSNTPDCNLKADDILKEYHSIDCVCCKQRFLINNFLKAGPNNQSSCKASVRQTQIQQNNRNSFEAFQCSGQNINVLDFSEQVKQNMVEEVSTDPNTKLKKKNKKKKKKQSAAKSERKECISCQETKSQTSKEEDCECTANDSNSSDESFEKTLQQFSHDLSNIENVFNQPRLIPNLKQEWLDDLKSSITRK